MLAELVLAIKRVQTRIREYAAVVDNLERAVHEPIPMLRNAR